MTHCPNCGKEIRPGDSLCPNCGADIAGVWPPPPGGARPPTPAPPSAYEIRRQVNNGTALGCLSGFLLWLGALFVVGSVPLLNRLIGQNGRLPTVTHGLALVALGFVYLYLRAGSPWFARGWGYSVVLVAALSLGMALACGA